MEREEFKLTAIKVLGLGAIGREITRRVATANFDGVETQYIDQNNTAFGLDDSLYEDLMAGIEMLILIFEPCKPDAVIYSILRAAKKNNILVVGLTLRYYFYNLDEELLFRDLISRGIDSLFSIFTDESNRDANEEAMASRHLAEDRLYDAAEGLVSMINVPQLIYLIFPDVCEVLSKKGHIYMGKGYGEGENKALDAIKMVLDTTPIIINNFMATKFTFLITGDIDLMDVGIISDHLRGLSEKESDVIFAASGTGSRDDGKRDACSVFLIASDYKAPSKSKHEEKRELKVPDFIKGKNVDCYVTNRSPKRFIGIEDDFEFEFLEQEESEDPEI